MSQLLEGVNLYSIDYYKKTVFKGSWRGLCFRVAKAETGGAEDFSAEADSVEGAMSGGSEEPETVLRVQAWKGPYVLEKTSEEVFTQDFAYSDEGLGEVKSWLEEKQREVIGNDKD